MDRIKAQWHKLLQILAKPETYAAYKNAVLLTWTIVLETALLGWLAICLFLVLFEWFWQSSVGAGRNFRNWFNGLEGSSDQIASETSKAILTAGKSSLDFTISTAKSQLGLPIESTKK